MNEIAMTISDRRVRRAAIRQSPSDLEPNNNQASAGAREGKHRRRVQRSASAGASGSDASVDEELDIAAGAEIGAKFVLGDDEPPIHDITALKQQEPLEAGARRVRSMSDGSPSMQGHNPDGEPFEVFPSLPDSVLEKLELNGHRNQKERLHDDELEQKFVALSLAFTIDATTIGHRCERQRRCRDQTENNLNAEIERLVEKAHRLRPLCVDAETTELLTALLAQVDVIVQAAEHAAIAAERYGAVQHEARLADGAQLMIDHVHVLKQQRDFARRQLAYTKRVLQDTSQGAADAHKHGARHGSHGNVLHAANGSARMVTKRRASIATLPRQDIFAHGDSKSADARKIARRTSELVLRGGNVLSRNARTPRLELGLDLVKIRENTVENHHAERATLSEEPEDEPTRPDHREDKAAEKRRENFSSQRHPSLEEEILEVELKSNQSVQSVEICTSHLKYKAMCLFRKLSRHCGHAMTKWWEDGAQGSFFYVCALVCFALSIVSLGNVLVEMEVERGGSFLHWLYSA